MARSPFRYPGGKSRLAPRVIALLAQQRSLSRYVEPFVGGGAVALLMAVRHPALELHLNDIDDRVASFWKVMSQADATAYEKMVRRVEDVVPSVDLWKSEKDAGFDGTLDDLAFRALFLNRCTFSGNMSLRSGGPIGGYDQTGKWKIDARWKLSLLLPALERVRVLLASRTVSVTAGPWEEVRSIAGLHYYDPPYMTVSAQTLYSSAFLVDDHLALRNHLRRSPYPWVLSYDQDIDGHIAWLYGFAHQEFVQHTSRVQTAGPQNRVEVLYWSPGRHRVMKRSH